MKVPTHDVSVIAEFAGAGVSQSVFSFDSPLPRMGVVEVIGTEGTLIVPDPNLFTGEVKITRAPAVEDIAKETVWESVPVTGARAGRGIGVLDMARSIRTGSRPMASGDLGYHVFDTLMAVGESVTTHQSVEVTSSVDPVPLVADDWDPTAATL